MDLEGIELVIFDKDGTLIDFHAMWSGWVEALARDLEGSTGRPIHATLFTMMGYDSVAGQAHIGGGLTSTPMARLRDLTATVLVDSGLTVEAAELALRPAWHPPDPVILAHPLTDLAALFGDLRTGGRRIAVATSDDREPTEATLRALGVRQMVSALACGDDGVGVKPDPQMLLAICNACRVAPARTAVVGDTPADLAMGRSAGAGLVIGVLSGLGEAEHLARLADLVLPSVADLMLD